MNQTPEYFRVEVRTGAEWQSVYASVVRKSAEIAFTKATKNPKHKAVRLLDPNGVPLAYQDENTKTHQPPLL